jgi:hypothetical protein
VMDEFPLMVEKKVEYGVFGTQPHDACFSYRREARRFVARMRKAS